VKAYIVVLLLMLTFRQCCHLVQWSLNAGTNWRRALLVEDSGSKETILAVSKGIARHEISNVLYLVSTIPPSAHDTRYRLTGLDGNPIDADELPTDRCIKCPCITIGHSDNVTATATSIDKNGRMMNSSFRAGNLLLAAQR
jgi:hypothetical protein